jgi:hypothetical protein
MRRFALLALLGLSACSAITDAGRFQGYKTLSFQLRGFDPHVGNRVDVMLVAESGDSGNVEGWIRLEPLGPEFVNSTTELFDTLDPGRNYHIDFFADFNNSGTYDAPDTDHSWRIPVATDTGVASYTHDFAFTNFNLTPRPMTHGDAIVRFSNGNVFGGQRLEARIYNPIGENVGYLRREMAAAPDLSFTIPAIIDAGSEYTIELIVGGHLCSPDITATAGANLMVDRDASDFTCQ